MEMEKTMKTVKIEKAEFTIKEAIEGREGGLWRVNSEYQRGLVWNNKDILLLVDSVLRGYRLPPIFLREVKGGTDYEIIDGQQRINAFGLFKASPPSLRLYDPKKDSALFPFDKESKQDFPWAGKTYDELSPELKEQFKETMLDVIVVKDTGDNDNVVRDIFLRLQKGRALSPQEVRDAWPGDFCDHILKIGGKPEIHHKVYHGHPFFVDCVRGGNSVQKRELAAKTLMLFLSRREYYGDFFPSSIGSETLDHCYQDYADMNKDENLVKDMERFQCILDTLYDLLMEASSDKVDKLKVHEVLNLVIFTDKLLDDYEEQWKEQIVNAFKDLSKELEKAKTDRPNWSDDEATKEFWWYKTKTKVAAGEAEAILARHEIFTKHMLRLIGENIRIKKTTRNWKILKEISERDEPMTCQYCWMEKHNNHVYGEAPPLDWDNEISMDYPEVHFVVPRSKGGEPVAENGVLTHRICKPRTITDTREFNGWVIATDEVMKHYSDSKQFKPGASRDREKRSPKRDRFKWGFRSVVG